MKITVFTHRHGISFDVVHDNVDCEEHWKEKDGYLGRNEDGMVIDDYEDVWEFSMPEPFNSAPELLKALEGMVADWERVTGRTLPDDHEVKAAISRAKGGAK